MNIHRPEVGSPFALRLFQSLAAGKPGKNLILSPISVAIALAMVRLGARGETLEAFDQVLDLTDTAPEERDRRYQELAAALVTPTAGVELSLANSLWLAETETFREEFLGACQEQYQATPERLSFRLAKAAAARINAWVKEATRDKIAKIVEPDDLSDALLVLLNSMYFKGSWRVPFDPARTGNDDFFLATGERRSLPLMRRSGKMEYWEEESCQVVLLPYGRGRFHFLVALPREGVNLDEFVANLDGPALTRWFHNPSPQDGVLALPRFTLEGESLGLVPALSALGLAAAFGGAADFGGISPGALAISKVQHRAMMEVNEEGTVAAAVTAIVMTRGLSTRPSFTMVVDRPFLCGILDAETDLPLFLASVWVPGS